MKVSFSEQYRTCNLALVSQAIKNVGPKYDSFYVYAIIISGMGACLNFSSSVPIYELLNEIRVVGGTLAPIRNSPNVNFMYIFNVTIPNAPLSVEAYESMLSSCVSSGRYTAYIQSAAANTPNSTALLHASSYSVTIGNGSHI